MADKQQRSGGPVIESTVVKPSRSQASTQGTEVDETAESNMAMIEELQTGSGSSAGLQNYQQTLGTWLGSELYGAVSDELELNSLAAHADKALTSAIRSAASNIDRLEDHPNVYMDPNFADTFSRAVALEFEGVAAAWVRSSEGQRLVGRLNNWVDANPETVATVGLLAAGGAIAANMEIPELKHKFDISDELTATVGVQLGRFRDIALEEVRGKLEYHSGNLIMAFEAAHDDDRGTSAQFQLKYSW